MATAQRRRILEAVILKTIGAQRRQILAAHGLEYALLAGNRRSGRHLLGTIVAWVAVTRIMELDVRVFSERGFLNPDGRSCFNRRFRRNRDLGGFAGPAGAVFAVRVKIFAIDNAVSPLKGAANMRI